MTLSKKVIFLAVFPLISPFIFAGTPISNFQHNPDSLFLKDNPVVAQLDSLVNSKFFSNTYFTTDYSKPNKYGFSVDSIPNYSDSVYRERINVLGVNSPFEFVYNQQVRNYIDVYAIKKRKLTARMLGMAEIYFPMFEEQLDKYGVPLELKYLPIIESALNPIARSRVGASGLWQFMLGTGKLYDLKVTSYVDDRCDPYKSTVAACQHLSDLYKIYHDWAIVLAAYNAGAGTVNRAIRTANIDTNERITYWKIQSFLPKETQTYVPAFIAVCYVMHYATEHNLFAVQPQIIHCDIDSITLTHDVTLTQISSYLCVPIESIQFLNPAYRKGVIPATGETPYVLCLPREYMGAFINNQTAIYCYKTPQEINYQDQLRQMTAVKTNPSPVVAKTTTPTITTQTAVSIVKPTATTYSKYVYHTVQKGDSLWSIASKYTGVSIDEIRLLNNLSVKQTIYPGQKLKIGLKG
ncbi:MAG: transglycosylase SLT domain-containing protein [Bacteroidota bacterium]